MCFSQQLKIVPNMFTFMYKYICYNNYLLKYDKLIKFISNLNKIQLGMYYYFSPTQFQSKYLLDYIKNK